MERILKEQIRRDTLPVNYSDDDGEEWYVVNRGNNQLAVDADGVPIKVYSHTAAYRIGFNMGLRDCMWWCPILVRDFDANTRR